ncbi:MAG: YpmA family protein [Syntrophomonas sp.]|uniref:YpmA family protein n=1 Tax=Syntrophomonas sp. TaxID=2053627 RepID=UPI00260CA0E3|nr:YpmA family protein [Syntrophomonas sp.]MDD2509767.1 YpmA family protein [Syntrophomonas sp.]MDD3878829.1 YpmA family protein [Syntrophomonas sp.]MDD4625740.1 YpmA family protein [Syntrophomonas sp.]
MQQDNGKLDLIASKAFSSNLEMVRIVDFLNKSLKGKKIMFGLSKDKEKEQMTISIYEFE